MKKLEYKRKPSCCPKCGGEVYELLYGMPNVGKEQELLERGIRYIYAGCAITEGRRPNPTFTRVRQMNCVKLLCRELLGNNPERLKYVLVVVEKIGNMFYLL